LTSLTACQSVNSHRSVGVEHNSKSGTHSSGRKIFGELSSNETVVAVSLDDSAPNSSEFSVVSNTLGLVNVSDPLAKVKACVLLIIDTLDLKKGELLMLSALASLEASENGLGVESTHRIRFSECLTSRAVLTDP
jgi:hypothetical protein